MADDAASQEDVLKSIIGQPTGKSKVVVERGPVQHFADAVLSASPIYHDPAAAKAAGFDGIPAPPTWPFAMEFSGKFAEMQPSDAPTGNPSRPSWVRSWPRAASSSMAKRNSSTTGPSRWGTC